MFVSLSQFVSLEFRSILLVLLLAVTQLSTSFLGITPVPIRLHPAAGLAHLNSDRHVRIIDLKLD